jgi:hypothetical protein
VYTAILNITRRVLHSCLSVYHCSLKKKKEDLQSREVTEKDEEERLGMRINENVRNDKDVRTKGIRMGHGKGKRRSEVARTNLLCVSPSLAPDPNYDSTLAENRGRQSL